MKVIKYFAMRSFEISVANCMLVVIFILAMFIPSVCSFVKSNIEMHDIEISLITTMSISTLFLILSVILATIYRVRERFADDDDE